MKLLQITKFVKEWYSIFTSCNIRKMEKNKHDSVF